MRTKNRKASLILVVLVALLLGLTASPVFANGALTISSFFVENGVAKVQVNNDTDFVSVKYHMYANGQFLQWGTTQVVSGQQELAITLVNPPTQINNAEVVIFKDQPQDELLASKYWDGSMPTPIPSATPIPPSDLTLETYGLYFLCREDVDVPPDFNAYQITYEDGQQEVVNADWSMSLCWGYVSHRNWEDEKIVSIQVDTDATLVLSPEMEKLGWLIVDGLGFAKPQTPEPTPMPEPTGTPVAPVAAEITYVVITETVKISLSAEADWHLYLDGTFNRYGHGTEFVVGLAEFSQSMEVVTNAGTDVQRNMFKTKAELLQPEPTPTPEPTGTPVAPVAAEITYVVITETVKISLSAEADWHLYLDGTFNRYGHGTEFVVGLAEFSQSMEVVTNAGTDVQRNMFKTKAELLQPEPTPTPEPTGTPVAPVAAEITYVVITETVKISLSAEADWHLYLDGTFNRYGHGTEFVVGLAEFSQSMEIITNPGVLDRERKLFVRRDEVFKNFLPLIGR